MADVMIGGVVAGEDGGLRLTGTSADVGREQVWVRIGDEWFKAKVDAATGDWTVKISGDDLAGLMDDEADAEGGADGDPATLEVEAGVYLHPAHRPGVGAHKVLADGDAVDTAVLGAVDGGAELIANGSFEADAIDEGTWAIAPLTGWTATDGAAELWNGLDGQPVSADGAQHIELDSDGRVDVVGQAVTTAAGEAYTLTLAYASRAETAGAGDTTDAFEVWWNGALVATLDPESTEWATFTAEVVATGSDVLELREAGANDGYGALVDDVSLVSVSGDDGWVLA